MSTELATTNGAAIGQPIASSNPSLSQVSATDILIPRLNLQQAISEMVQKGLAKAGDVIRSTDKKALPMPLEVVPIIFKKRWQIKRSAKENDSRGEFVESVPWTPESDKAPLNWRDGAWRYWRDLNLDLYCLLAKDIKDDIESFKQFEETGELPEASCMPVVISFQRTSYKAGKAFATHFMQCADVAQRSGKDVPPYGYVFELGKEFVEKDNSWYEWRAERKRKVDADEKETAARWAGMLAQSNIEIDDPEGEAPAAPSEQPPAAAGQREF